MLRHVARHPARRAARRVAQNWETKLEILDSKMMLSTIWIQSEMQNIIV